MNLTDTVNKLGHYAKKVAKAVLTPVNTGIALVTLGVALSFNPIQAQTNPLGDTIWGTGYFLTRDIVTEDIIPNTNLYLTPSEMQMVIPDTTYEYLTGNISTHFKLPVYIDSTVGVTEWKEQSPIVFPSVGSEINVVFQKPEKGVLFMFDLNGNTIKQKSFFGSTAYLQLNNLRAGLYIYHITTESGIETGGKFIKQNVALKGPSLSPIPSSRGIPPYAGDKASPENMGFAQGISPSGRNDSYDYEATYWAKWEHEDYRTDSTLITIHDGLNPSVITFYMKEINEYVYGQFFFVLSDTTNGSNQEYISDFSLEQHRTLTGTIHSHGLLAIYDCKLGDIGSTAQSGLFHYNRFGYDAITVDPFAGNLDEIVKTTHSYAPPLGTIVWVLPTNPESVYLKEARIGDKPLYVVIAEKVKKSGADGCVVGATGHVTKDDITTIRGIVGDDNIFLVPGVGAQGGNEEKVIRYGGRNLIINVGRDIIYTENPRNAAEEYYKRFNELKMW